jgi:hypothetical protein
MTTRALQRPTLEPDGKATGCNPVEAGSTPAGVSDCSTWTIEGAVPACPAIPAVTRDFLDEPWDAKQTIAGPILRLRGSGQLAVSPIREPWGVER